jgi:xanthosine utilization system XapX-like protein
MKIYMLMMLIGVIVGLSYLPIRVRAKQASPVAPDSVPA